MASAGDIVPPIAISKVLRSPGGVNWSHDQLQHGLTVLEFYPKLSNSQMYRVHNERVERYAGRGVQFVLIARDEESAIQRWLDKYRIELMGWVLLDWNWETARTFGIRLSQTVFIDSGKVVGFSTFNDPTDWQVEEVVEGRAGTAGLHEHSDFHGIVGPGIPPSETVQISEAQSASGTTVSEGPDHWIALGHRLKELIAMAWTTHESLMNLAPALDSDQRYDVRLVLPAPEGPEAIAHRIQLALKQHFALAVTYERQSVAVYVIGWRPGDGSQMADPMLPPGRTLPDLPFPTQQFSMIGKGFNVNGTPIRSRNGLVVAHPTDREGYQGLDVAWLGDSGNGLLRALRDDFGIIPTREEMDILTIRPRQIVVQ